MVSRRFRDGDVMMQLEKAVCLQNEAVHGIWKSINNKLWPAQGICDLKSRDL